MHVYKIKKENNSLLFTAGALNYLIPYYRMHQSKLNELRGGGKSATCCMGENELCFL